LNQQAFDFVEETDRRKSRTGAFTDNMAMPVHRWFRYSAGFSAAWAQEVIVSAGLQRGEYVFDPFVGSGTSLIAAQTVGCAAAGSELHPFVAAVAEAKLCWVLDERDFIAAADEILRQAEMAQEDHAVPGQALLERCYSPEALRRLQALRAAFENVEMDAGVR